ncbi:uncharacterized protein BX663DRAFT_9519 [Cokeromyces recurvatus]|uniref:uncharacterized protein n=1 Tax=Cokeromyces recurvatus TaxID=90255 RepID=UPI00221FAC30|nr:uncharacterized protein BX663DRAFT_9519 [Cokeromyces recurvatus]KAI7907726.1 hypothetical protein BX663DRAFT_9519 [Cokeromyces recurvatus]
MSKKQQNKKINTEENERLQTQIDASIGIARTLIQSWLPPPKPGEKLEDEDEDQDIYTKYSSGRPDRLGLGAKFLSHAEAMRHNNNGALPSKEELVLKNKILNQNKRASQHRDSSIDIRKRSRPQDQSESSDEDEEGSRSNTVGIKNKKKIESISTTSNSNNKKKIGNQGDFLSMYLSERASKKKNKKK